jgi:hypothetical protein
MGDAKDAKQYVHKGGSGAFLFLGFVGALVYYIQQADGFGEIIVAILKAMVWPAFFVYDVLKFVS